MKNKFLNIIGAIAVTSMVMASCNSSNKNLEDTDTAGQTGTGYNDMPSTGNESDTSSMYNEENEESGTGRTGSGSETGTGTGRMGTGGGGGTSTDTSGTNNNQNNF